MNPARGPVWLAGDQPFPDPGLAMSEGIVALGGDLGEERLLSAYRAGIFPWYEEGTPILWWSPDPRFILLPGDLHVSRSLAARVRSERFEVRYDTAFAAVIRRCAEIPRPDQDGTWITPDMVEAYERLHAAGYAHSAESWNRGELVGGLYGVSLGSAFFGESMFASASDASKVAFTSLVERLRQWGFDLIDCQMNTEHLARFGASDMPRPEFLDRLAVSLEHPTRCGPWTEG